MIVGDGKTGIAAKIDSKLTDWLATKGIIQSATDGVSKTLNKLTTLYNTTSDRIDADIARYKTQFTQLDMAISKLNSTSTYLTQQFDTSDSSKK